MGKDDAHGTVLESDAWSSCLNMYFDDGSTFAVHGLLQEFSPWWSKPSVFRKSATLYAEYNPSANSIVEEAADNDVNRQDHQGKTALMKAVTKTWANAITQLIHLNCNVNIAADNKTRAIHIAAQVI